MGEFVYLYRNAERPPNPEKMQQQMQKWMTWLKELQTKGHIKDAGHPLERSGKLVKNSGKSISDGPFAEAKDVIGGYTLVEAKDLAQAAELAGGCPIFNVGGYVEVRPVMKM